MQRVLISDLSVPAANSISNTAAETAFTWLVPFPANSSSGDTQGRTYRLKLYGYHSSDGTTPGTLTLKLKWGSTALCATRAITVPVSLSNAGWIMDAVVRICTTGTSGKVSAQGFFTLDNAGTAIVSGMVNTGTGTTGQITINTQTAQNLTITATMSSALAANTIVLADCIIEELA